jgi:hypothetical protein
MVSKNLPNQYPNCNTDHTLILCGHHKMRESLYTRVVLFGSIPSSYHVDTKVILPGFEGPCMVSKPELHQNPPLILIPYWY